MTSCIDTNALKYGFCRAGITRVANDCTSDFKYPKELYLLVSKMLMETPQKQGRWL